MDVTLGPLGRPVSSEEALVRGRWLAAKGGRRLLGITGTPGAGKSTLMAEVVDHLEGAAIGVPMDGFHLARSELRRLGRADRMGAPDTFDASGYVALLRRIREDRNEVVYAPEFRREIEEPIAGAIAVPPDVPLVVTEGNYLLLGTPPWAEVRGVLDEVWYVEPEDDAARIERLIARHVRFGKSDAEARAWVARSDESNARIIRATRERADVVVRLRGRS